MRGIRDGEPEMATSIFHTDPAELCEDTDTSSLSLKLNTR